MKKRTSLSVVTGVGLVVIAGSLVVVNRYLNQGKAEDLPVSAATANLVTKRFGECPTCAVKNVTTDAALSEWSPAVPFEPTSRTLRLDSYAPLANPILRFDLSSLQGKTIRDVKFSIGLTGYGLSIPYANGTDSTVTAKIYDLGAGGAWDETQVSYNYINTSTSTKWSATGTGNVSTVFTKSDDSKIGELFFKDYLDGESASAQGGTMLSSKLDLATVQRWVTSPQTNNGFIIAREPSFNKSLASKTYIGKNMYNEDVAGTENLRPYLEITYEDENVSAPTQPTNVHATYYRGQTFVTWDEAATGVDETSYRIYRSTAPITDLSQAELVDQVNQGSSYITDNHYEGGANEGYVQPDLSPAGVTLNANSGMYVYNVKDGSLGNEATAYYTVTTVTESNENRSLSGNTSNSVSERIDKPDFFYYRQYGRYAGYVIWLGDYNWNDPADPFGFHSKRSAPYMFSIALPAKSSPYYPTVDMMKARPKLSTEERFALTTALHASGHTLFISQLGEWCSRSINSENYGGFCLGFDDTWKESLKVMREGQPVFVHKNFLDTVNGNAYYAGWNSNYSQRNGLMDSCMKSKDYATPEEQAAGTHRWDCVERLKRPSTMGVEKRVEDGRSIMYSEKSIAFVIDTLLNRSSWSDNLDSNRIYATGGSLGAGGSLALAMHNPTLFTAIDTLWGRTKMTGADFKGKNPDLWGSPAANIKTQDGVGGPTGEGIWDYMNMDTYVKKNRGLDYPLIQTFMGKQDTTVRWDLNHPFYFKADTGETNTRLGLRMFFDQATHSGGDGTYGPRNSTLWPDFKTLYVESTAHAVHWISQPYWNVYHLRTNQSYPAFTNFSNNSDPGTGDPATGDLRGAINRYPTWDTSTIVDQANQYSITLSMFSNLPRIQKNATEQLRDIAAVETVDVTPRRLQSLPHTPGLTYIWKNLRASDNQELQSGVVVADQDGLVTVPGFQLYKDQPTKLTLELTTPGSNLAYQVRLQGRVSSGQTIENVDHSGAVSGELLDENGNSLSPAQTFSTTSASNGVVSLSTLISNAAAYIKNHEGVTYKLKVRPKGYLPQIITVTSGSLDGPTLTFPQTFVPGAFAGTSDTVQLSDFAMLATYFNGGTGSPGVVAAYGSRSGGSLLAEFARLSTQFNNR